jgi:hypothetical protein
MDNPVVFLPILFPEFLIGLNKNLPKNIYFCRRPTAAGLPGNESAATCLVQQLMQLLYKLTEARIKWKDW